MAQSPDAPPEACPVDPATRAAWLKSKSSTATFPGTSAAASRAPPSNSCDSSQMDQSPPASEPKGFLSRLFWSSPPPGPSSSNNPSKNPRTLGVDREISTIPRASPIDRSEGGNPANSEKEGGVSASGNWIYPSERMFFEAMKRKGYAADAQDMRTIGTAAEFTNQEFIYGITLTFKVPIHNAINERSWKEIKDWERPYGAEAK